ncbi:urea ABC transporter ATP-binding subunit UrtE [Algiphilus sp.]|uniref:urea ABC transporter ATP-binding subunit UrtE n=1 Tax=Algiphilus sp. TaxID=1872431 RepID=UPI0025C0EC50|nr:urea ABC transporter ATP-binding subunit UrtE [Algiphilus sp.]MCK5768726.1 urea ABC transporter ATP-binding subunit UrtE [Algiphilus sp.]
MSETSLQLRGLNQFYGGSHILWDVDMTVPKGAITCLMGRNGMGKTTLLKCVMGLLPASGAIHFGDADITRMAADRRAAMGIGYVPQGREIFPQLTVAENLQLGVNVRRDRSADALERIFALFPVLKSMLKRRGGDLSGGQQQQLAIGRALVFEPSLLILDEPCEGIQPNIVAEIGDTLIKLNREEGLSVLLVEQKLPFARRVADAFRILEKGRLVAEGGIDGLTDDIVRKHLSV